VTERIVIDFAAAEGAVLRMLGLVERRGFEVRGISMGQQDGRGSLTLDVQPRDESRRLEVVAGQLKRLNEVRNVSLSTPASGHML
jgi:acetolactate synthase regulatory subunit